MPDAEATDQEKALLSDGEKISWKSMVEDDDFLIKWSGPMLLGPFVPAVFALLTIFIGHITLNTWEGSCGYALDGFIGGAMFVSYVFLMVYSWAFIGVKVWCVIPFAGIGFFILKPFTKLKVLMVWYFFVFMLSFIVWIVGTALLDLSVFCEATAPELYRFSAFLVVTYWIGFCVIVIYMIKKRFGKILRAVFDNTRQGPTVEDMEEKIFRKEFKKLDTRKKGSLNPDFLPELFKKVGVYIPDEQLSGVITKVGLNDAEELDFYPLLNWFREYNQQTSAYANTNEDDQADMVTSVKKKDTGKEAKIELEDMD